MEKRRRRKESLGREDWIRAALVALGEKGLAGIAVEPLAERLGVTKGSFYWHFKDLDELIEAALRRWAVDRTRESIAELERVADPRERLRRLMTRPAREPAVGALDLAVLASAVDPRVSRWLRQHHRLWLQFAGRAFRQMGFSEVEARHRAILAYTSWLGLVSLVSGYPRSLPGESARTGYVSFARDLLVPARESRRRP